MAAMPVDRHAMIHTVFRAMDADESGEIDEEEFLSMFSDKEGRHAKSFLATIDSIHADDTAAGDGQLNMKEFCEFMVEYTAKLTDELFKDQIARWHKNVEGSARRLLLRRVFKAMDTDRSGSISLQEFRALVTDDSKEDGEDAAVDLFRWIEGDSGDGDGELTVDEWVPFVLAKEQEKTDEEFQQMVDEMLECLARKKRETLLRQVFLRMDADGSGSVDREEFENLQDGGEGDAERLAMIHSYVDAEFGDANGELSADEWVRGMKAMGEDMEDDEFEAEIGRWMAALAKNQRKVWRNIHAKGQAREFVIASRASSLTHILFVQNAHATLDGASHNAEDWKPLKHALLDIKGDSAPRLQSTPTKVGLVRPASASVLTPLSPNVPTSRAKSAHPNSRLGASESTPALLSEVEQAPSAAPAAVAVAWAAPTEVPYVAEVEVDVDVQEEMEAPEPELKLTDRGTAQALHARRSWFGRFPVRNMLLTSPARSAKESALHLAGRREEARQLSGDEAASFGHPSSPDAKLRATPLRIIEKLAPSKPSSLCAELVTYKSKQQVVKDSIFATAPPLHTLLDAEGGEFAFGTYAETACEELASAVRGAPGYLSGKGEKDSNYLAVFAHGGYMMAVAHAVAAAADLGTAELDQMIQLGVGDMEAVLVPLFGGNGGKKAILIKRAM